MTQTCCSCFGCSRSYSLSTKTMHFNDIYKTMFSKGKCYQSLSINRSPSRQQSDTTIIWSHSRTCTPVLCLENKEPYFWIKSFLHSPTRCLSDALTLYTTAVLVACNTCTQLSLHCFIYMSVHVYITAFPVTDSTDCTLMFKLLDCLWVLYYNPAMSNEIKKIWYPSVVLMLLYLL